MPEDLRQNPSVQAELDAIAYLESKRGKYLRPFDTKEMSFGTYHLNALGLVDAVNNGLQVPESVKTIVGDWNARSTSDRWQVQHDLFQWMLKHRSDVDAIAEEYYTQVVRPRAGNAGVPAIMEWQAPGSTKKDYATIGVTPRDVDADPKTLERFLHHIETNGSSDRASRARELRHVLPLLDYSRTVPPADTKTAPRLPQHAPLEQYDPRVPYPTTDITDPWMQLGHAVTYQESIKDYGDILGEKTIRAAVQLHTTLDKDAASRGLLQKGYGAEALEPSALSPVDLSVEFAVAPYGIAKAATDVIGNQLEGDLSLTERLQDGMLAVPLVVGSIFTHKSMSAARSALRGATDTASPEQVAAAKDVYSRQLESHKQVREGIQIRLQTAEAAGDIEGATKAKRDLSTAKRKELFLETILDNDRGEAEIRRLEYWLSGLREDGAPASQIKEVEKRLAAAQRHLQDAQDALKLPSAEALQRSLDTYQNLVKGAKISEQSMHQASEELIRNGKVSLDTIMARDIDAAVNPIEQQAELRIVQDLTNTITALRSHYTASNGGIIEAHALSNAINVASIVLGKHRRGEIRAGQSVQVLSGKSRELRTLEDVVEHTDPQTMPAFMHIWNTATTDLDRVGQLRKLAQPGVFKGSLMQVLTNNLISSPATAFWNVMSMGGMTLSRMNELRLLGKLDPAHVAQDEAGVFASALVGYYGRLITGDVKAAQAWNEQFHKASLRSAHVDPGVVEKYNFRTSISANSLGVTGAWGQAVNTLGYMINLPTQFSAWADAFVAVGVKDAFSKVLAHRQAYMELQGELKLGAKLSQEQIHVRLAAREQEILANPNSMMMVDGKAVRIADLATEEASVISMMGKLQSHALGGVEKWANNSLLARMAVPFPHPFLQTAEMALERTPIGRLLPHMRADLAAGGARAAAAHAKLATGNQTAALFATFAGLAYLSGQGNVDQSDWIGFTGSGPFKEGQKSLWAATHRADTVRVAGKEFPLSKLGPVGQVMSATADAMGIVNEIVNLGDKSQMDKVIQISSHVAAMWTSLVASELFASDLKDIASGLILRDPAAFERVIERKSSMLVPAIGFMKDLSHILSETNKVLQTEIGDVKAVTPLNFWGDPTRYYGTQNPFSTIIGLTERNAPDFKRKNEVANRLIADDVAITAPSKTLVFDDVTLELSTEQQMAARRYFAQAVLPLPSGKHGTLLQGLEEMVRSPVYGKLVAGSGENADYYSRFHVGSKQDYITMYVEKRKDATKKWLLAESDWAGELQARLINTKRARQFDIEHPPGTRPAEEPSATGTRTPFTFGLGGIR